MMIIMVRDGMGWFTRWGSISDLLVDYGWSVGQKIVVAISNLFYVVLYPILPPKFYPNQIKNSVQIFEIRKMLRRCQKSAKSKLTILEHFTWSHRIWNNENIFGVRYVQGLILLRKRPNFHNVQWEFQRFSSLRLWGLFWVVLFNFHSSINF